MASTAVELDEVSIWDWYMYDGGVRILIKQWWSWWGGAYFKTQVEYDALPSSKESDNNLYIIVDKHRLMEYSELILLTPDEIVAELNSASQEYINKYSSENHMSFYSDTGKYILMEDAANHVLTKVGRCSFWTKAWTIVWEKSIK